MLSGFQAAIANNIQLSNIHMGGQNATSHFTMISYDVSWENSWRTSTNENNYDGAWIFVKYRKVNTSEWRHATINYTAPGTATASGHIEPTGSTIKPAIDGKGIWMYRSANGIGNVSFAGAQLRWNYGADNVNDNDSVEVRVFAVEMVYIPGGSFYAGSGGSEAGAFKAGNTTAPYLVSSAGPITVGSSAGSLSYTTFAPNYAGDQAGPIPATFPNGFGGFWLMKYECSEQQYADFLNHLDAARATANFTPPLTGAHPNYLPAVPEHAMNGMSWSNLTAYADWTGMRPYTELEYEKASRGGNISAVPNEYPWGNTTIVPVSTLQNINTTSEVPDAFANCNNNSVSTRRCGVFATSTATRDTAGAGYYGNMELAGNVWEQVVTVGSPAGRAFTNVNGDGYLDPTGASDISTWIASGVNGARGGGYTASPVYCRTSDRTNGVGLYIATVSTTGIRVARSAE